MKKNNIILLLLILQLVVTPNIGNASEVAGVEPATATELADLYRNVFIANVTSKIIGSDHTYYVFHVVEYLTRPLNTSNIYITVHGGSEIMVSTSTTFYVGLEYIIFCDEINEEYSLTGNHYQYKLLDSVDPDELENIRKTLMAEKACTINNVITLPEKITDPANIAEKAVEPSINPPTKEIDLTPEQVKENRAYDNALLTIVMLCITGMYLTLLPATKRD